VARTVSSIVGADRLLKKFGQLEEAVQGQAIEEAGWDGALLFQRAVQTKAPVGPTGVYRASIRTELALKTRLRCEFTTGTNAAQAFALEFGSGLHATGEGAVKAKYPIEPDEKKALFWPGAEHPVFRVMHPGIEAQPHFRPAYDEQKKNVVAAVKQKLRLKILGAIK
jgi:hypothetical protein